MSSKSKIPIFGNKRSVKPTSDKTTLIQSAVIPTSENSRNKKEESVSDKSCSFSFYKSVFIIF